MKLIIAGSRDIPVSHSEWELIESALTFHGFRGNISEIITGNSGNIDLLGNFYSEITGCPLKLFNPEWDVHGRAAGPIRNKEMAEYSDALLLIWDGESRGSKSMKEEMLKLNKPVYEVILRKHNAD